MRFGRIHRYVHAREGGLQLRVGHGAHGSSNRRAWQHSGRMEDGSKPGLEREFSGSSVASTSWSARFRAAQGGERALRQRQDTLSAERATLMQKNEQVRARVEAMIGRLKAMESGA
jgi:uncharacterized protein (TIGR02449 family)